MRCPRNPSALARGALGLALLAPGAARAQDAPEKADRPASAAREEPNFESREALNQHYDQRFAELDRRRIADLVALAGRVAGPEAEASYRDAFTLAVTRDLYDAAEPGADAYLGSGRTSPQTRALAEFVKIIAQASRQEYTQAVRSLEQFLKNQQAAAAAGPGQKADPNTVFAIGEAFLQRLMRAGRYDTARQVGALLAGSTDPTVRQHFTSRMARLEMLGKPAPPLAASDIDGRRIDLATLRGKVVLINFWVTWAPPSVAEIPHLNTLASQYGPRGFEVVGVNLDAAQQGADPARVQAGVRQFLVNSRVPWPNIVGPAAGAIAQAYGVTEIPATFLLDRDGKIIHVELSGPELDKAVAEALGGPSDSQGTPKESARSSGSGR